MKKTVLILSLILSVGLSVYAADMVYNRVFMMRTMKCLPTSSYVTSYVDEEGVNVKVIRKIGYWQDHKCLYSETTIKDDVEETYNCQFNREQLTDFANAMRTDPMNTGLAASLWEKYIKDENTCKLAQ